MQLHWVNSPRGHRWVDISINTFTYLGASFIIWIGSENIVQILLHSTLSLGPYPIALQKCSWDWTTVLMHPHPSCTKGPKYYFFTSKGRSGLLSEDKTCRLQAYLVICEIRVSLYLTGWLKDQTGGGFQCILNGSSGINQVTYNLKISGPKQQSFNSCYATCPS